MKTIQISPKSLFSALIAQLKPIALLCLFFLFACEAKTQSDSTGTLEVTLKDAASTVVIPFANVIVYNQKNKQIAVATTNQNGECSFRLLPGLYNVKAVYVGYTASSIKNVKIQKGKTNHLNMNLNGAEPLTLQEVEVIKYQEPLIDPDTKSGQMVVNEEYSTISPPSNNRAGAPSGELYSLRAARVYEQAPYYPNYQGNSEQYEESPENKFKLCSNDPLSTFSSDVDVASYANIRRMLNQGQLPPKEAVRIEEMLNYFRYQYPQPKKEEAFAIHSEISACPWNQKHRLLQIGIQGRAVEIQNAQANYLTFLIDVSGSMQTPDKLPLLKDAMTLLVKQLRENDRVAIVVYAGNAGLVLPSTPGHNKEKILDAIQALEAGGSTAGGEGIELAYEIARKNFSNHANNRVILATDGDFNVGISDDESLVKLIEQKRDEGIFLTVLGLGSGNYKDAKMEKLADKGNGNYAYLDNLLEAKKVLVKEIGGTLLTIAKDVKIQIEFNPLHVKSYRLIGYDNRMLAHEDFKNDKKDAGDVGSGHSVTALYEIVPAGSEEEANTVDELKYQKKQATSAAIGNEICTIKLRYKEPKEAISKEISKVVNDQHLAFENTSANFKFCAAVAEFGLLLRQSEFKGESNYQDILRLAKASKGNDEEGYRAEFIRMCEMSDMLANK